MGLLILPTTMAWELLCGTIFALGLWACLFPPGILGWAKAAHRELDPLDESLWWIPRVIGVAFIVFSVFLAISTLMFR